MKNQVPFTIAKFPQICPGGRAVREVGAFLENSVSESGTCYTFYESRVNILLQNV